jgi:hypothetical protein
LYADCQLQYSCIQKLLFFAYLIGSQFPTYPFAPSFYAPYSLIQIFSGAGGGAASGRAFYTSFGGGGGGGGIGGASRKAYGQKYTGELFGGGTGAEVAKSVSSSGGGHYRSSSAEKSGKIFP